MGTCFWTYATSMVFYTAPGQTAPPSGPAGTASSFEAARAQRNSQLRYLEERLRNRVSPATVADMTALLGQLEAQQTLPSMAVSIVADVTAYKSTITCRNVVWDGYDHTHQFQDDRSTAVYRPSNQTVFDQRASSRMLPQVAPVQTVASQPVQITNQAYRPNPQQVVEYPNSPAFSASRMALQSTPQTTLEPAGSSQASGVRAELAQFIAPPDMSSRTPKEQAVIAALQAVSNYPE